MPSVRLRLLTSVMPMSGSGALGADTAVSLAWRHDEPDPAQPLPVPGDDRGVRRSGALRGLLAAPLGRAERRLRARPERRPPVRGRDRRGDPSPASAPRRDLALP